MHQGNIHIGTPKEGEDPYALTLLDFGLAKKITPERMRYEWDAYAYILKQATEKLCFGQKLARDERNVKISRVTKVSATKRSNLRK